MNPAGWWLREAQKAEAAKAEEQPATPALQAAKTAQLVGIYNTYATKPVNKFADRPTALKRVIDLLAAAPGMVDLDRVEAGDVKVLVNTTAPKAPKKAAKKTPHPEAAPNSHEL